MKVNFLIKDEGYNASDLEQLLNINNKNASVSTMFDEVRGYDALVVDISLLEELENVIPLLDSYKNRVVYVSTSNNYNIKHAYKILKKNSPPYHIVGLNSKDCLKKVVDLVEAFETGAVKTLEDLVGSTEKKVEVKVKDSANIGEQIKQVLGGMEFENCFSSIKDSLSQLINELLYNALFNAPTDQNGQQTYRDQDRKQHVLLDEDKAATLKIFNGPDRIFTSVVDRYGSITKEVIDSHIYRNQVSDKAGGAGIGLSLIYNNSHELIFVVEPGVKTEVISVINKYKRFKHNQKHVRSFHFFIRGGD